ncbi:MAG: hypothetical protein J1E84_07605 [Muribaculaceae bacterium]|nr:hypothetical protein [Muribaculaceae bacterium]
MNMRKNLIYLILTAILAGIVSPAYAQKPTAQERRQWMAEMQNYKKEYIVKAVQLTDEQKAKFLPLYDAMEGEMQAIGREVRQAVKTVSDKKTAATDADYNKAVDVMYNAKSREAAVEKKYYAKFKAILTPRQLYELKSAENRFTREMMRHNSKSKKADKKTRK